MKKKGQVDIGIGAFIVTFIAILTGVILFQAVAQQVGDSTNTQTIANLSLGTVTNGTNVYIADYKSISEITMLGNGTLAPVTLTATNWTLTNNAIDPSDGELKIRIAPLSALYSGTVWRISGTVEPVGYISDSGARSVAGMIAVFFALAIAVIALEPTLRSKIIDMVR